MEQPQYNMLHRDRVEREYQRLYPEIGLGATIWSPLASGILTGKYSDGVAPGSRFSLEDYQWLRERSLDSPSGRDAVRKAAAVGDIARGLGVTAAQLAIAWCLVNPNVSTVILGASSTAQLRENLGAIEVLGRLDSALLERIEAVLDNKPELPTQF
jgi:aryl-alcohol dehydrogenase-like predicted oxidoreductase